MIIQLSSERNRLTGQVEENTTEDFRNRLSILTFQASTFYSHRKNNSIRCQHIILPINHIGKNKGLFLTVMIYVQQERKRHALLFEQEKLNKKHRNNWMD